MNIENSITIVVRTFDIFFVVFELWDFIVIVGIWSKINVLVIWVIKTFLKIFFEMNNQSLRLRYRQEFSWIRNDHECHHCSYQHLNDLEFHHYRRPHRKYRGYRPHLDLLVRQEYHHCHHHCQHNHGYHHRLGLDRQEYHHYYHPHLNDWGSRHYHRRHQDVLFANLTLSHLVG